jgi:predicted HTH domain antitoxin
MDFHEAIAAHTKWKIRLFQAIRGHEQLPEAAEIARVDLCLLGKWLAAEGVQYASYASHREGSHRPC